LFANELRSIARRYPACSIRIIVTAAEGAFDWQTFAQLYADVLRAAQVYACGPKRFTSDAKAVCQAAGAANFLSESYGMSTPAPADQSSGSWPLSLINRKQVFTIPAQLNLLQGMEALGLNPRFGCRAGICKQCICLKRSGLVQNLQTGERSNQSNEWISICTHQALSPVELVLE
jgi:stearoyl-CoA 9-desaturase NADPH oxidoreductase